MVSSVVRRAVVLAGVLTLVVCLGRGQPARGQRLPDVVKVVRTVVEILDGLSTASEILDWASDVVRTAEGDLPAPASSPEWEQGGYLETLLEAQRSKLAALDLPTFDTPLPAVGELPTSSFDAVRNTLRPQVLALRVAAFELQDGDAARRQLEALESTVKTRILAASRVADILLEATKRVPVPQLQLQLAGAMFDIETRHIPILRQIESDASGKARSMSRAIRTRSAEVAAAAVQLRAALAVESAALSGEAERLRHAWEALDERRRELDRRRAAADLEARAILELGYRVDELRADAAAEERRVSNLQGAIQQAQRDIDGYVTRRRSSFRCSEGYSWDRCRAHQEQKDTFDRNSRNSAYVKDRERSIRNYREEIDRRRNNTRSYRQQAAEIRREVSEREAALAIVRRRLRSDEATFERDVRADLEDRWRSRANLHADANAKDQAEIEAMRSLLSSLGR